MERRSKDPAATENVYILLYPQDAPSLPQNRIILYESSITLSDAVRFSSLEIVMTIIDM